MNIALKLIAGLLLAVSIATCGSDNKKSEIDARDENNNGLKDTVDEFIKSTALNAEQKSGLVIYANAIQKILSAKPVDKLEYSELNHRILAAHSCSSSKFDKVFQSFKWQRDVKALVVSSDTEQRTLQVFEQKTRELGLFVTLPRGDHCH